ncbi:MAG: hypothetical protein SFY96_04615 [Planctomycetota bacterium]|nr:hypothetical protein [Planctomycetota bacterium]
MVRHSHAVRCGHSLTSVLGVVAAAAVLASVVVPITQAQSKRTRADASRYRMGELSKMHFRYAAQNGGKMYFPWYGSPREGYGFRYVDRRDWLWVYSSPAAAETMSLDTYALLNGKAGLDVRTDLVQFAPDDGLLVSRMRASVAAGDFAPTWSGSFCYSPTMWFKPSTFAAESARATSSASNLTPQRVDAVAFPSAKVLLFERLGFYNSSGFPVGVSRQAPTWANPEARVNVSMMDGSVLPVEMASVNGLATSTDASVRAVFHPSGPLKLYSDTSPGYEFNDDMVPPVNPFPAGQSDFRSFFWATRNGVQGRDFDRSRATEIRPRDIAGSGVVSSSK